MSDKDIISEEVHDDGRLNPKSLSDDGRLESKKILMAKLQDDDSKIHSKITLNEVLDKIETDSEFHKLTEPTDPVSEKGLHEKKEIEKKVSKSIGNRKEFNSWLKVVRTKFIAKHYPNFELRKLRMIVVDSSWQRKGVLALAFDEYSSKRNDHWGIKEFIEIINDSLGLKESRKGTRYDYFCTATKDQVLFINIFLGKYKNLSFATYSIKFINKILEETQNQPIAILDARESKYVCFDDKQEELGSAIREYNSLIAQLESVRSKSQNIFRENFDYHLKELDKIKFKFQEDKSFKIKYFEKHEYVFIGDPSNVNDTHFKKLQELNAKTFPIDRLYIFDQKTNEDMKNRLFKMVKIIENDYEFVKKIFQFKFFKDELESLLNVQEFKEHFIKKSKDAPETELIRFKYNKWFGDIKKFIESNCLSEPYKLKTIVIGSVGFENFCTSTAFVAQDFGTKYTVVPNSVKKFADFLDDINYANGFKLKDTDLYAQHAREQGFLFLNTCLSICTNEAINSVCTVEFINQILLDSAHNGQKLAVLDMRLTRYVSECETVPELEQDERFSGYCLKGDEFKLVNPKDFHHLVRLGNPAFWSGNSDEEKYIKNQIDILMNEGYEISCIYLAKGDYETVKRKMTESSDNSNQKKKSSQKERDDRLPDDDSKQDSSDQKEILDKPNDPTYPTDLKENKLSSEIVLKVTLAYASKFNWNVKKRKYTEINDVIKREKQSKVCDCFYLGHGRFVLICESEKEALIFKVKEKTRNFLINFIGINIQYQSQLSQFILSQAGLIEEASEQKMNLRKVMPLLYDLSIKTRPDICATVDLLRSYLAKNPSNEPSDVVKDLINYLKLSKDSKFIIKGVDLCAYSDASYRDPLFISRFQGIIPALEHTESDIVGTNISSSSGIAIPSPNATNEEICQPIARTSEMHKPISISGTPNYVNSGQSNSKVENSNKNEIEAIAKDSSNSNTKTENTKINWGKQNKTKQTSNGQHKTINSEVNSIQVRGGNLTNKKNNPISFRGPPNTINSDQSETKLTNSDENKTKVEASQSSNVQSMDFVTKVNLMCQDSLNQISNVPNQTLNSNRNFNQARQVNSTQEMYNPINDRSNVNPDLSNTHPKNINQSITNVKTNQPSTTLNKSQNTRVNLEMHTKSNRPTKIDEIRSQLGLFVLLFGVPVAWLSEKEKNNKSSELEIIAQVKISRLLANISNLMKEIESKFFVDGKIQPYTILYTDHRGRKEKKLDKVGPLNELYELTERTNVEIKYVRSNNNVADHFTRILFLNTNQKTKNRNADIRDRLGLVDPNNYSD